MVGTGNCAHPDRASARDGKLGRSSSERPKATAADIGLSRKDIHEARQIRDAEKADPGIVRRTVDEAAKGWTVTHFSSRKTDRRVSNGDRVIRVAAWR